jgi:hypothetical protein
VKRSTSKIFLVAAAAAVVPTFCGGLAGASNAHHPQSTLGLTSHINLSTLGGRTPAVPATSYGAGYFSYPGDSNQGVSGASATFVMPSFSCASSSDDEWLLPGIWVYNSSGDLTEQVDVNFNCNDGSLFEGSVVEVGGTEGTSISVSPGDTIEASLSESGTATTGTIKDVTRGFSDQAVGSATTSDETVFIGDTGPSQFSVSGVPTFSKVKFTQAFVNSEYLGDWGPAQYNLRTAHDLQITGGPLSLGDAFTTTFKRNY